MSAVTDQNTQAFDAASPRLPSGGQSTAASGPQEPSVRHGFEDEMTEQSTLPQCGEEFRVAYPFIRETFTEWSADGPAEQKTWRPGVRMEPSGPEDVEAVADAMGEMILAVVSIHKPGRFPTRIFYTRRWRDPNGHEFGKTACRCAIVSKFRRLARGYQHEFRIIPVVDQSEIAGSQQIGRARLPLRSCAPNSRFDSGDGGQLEDFPF